MHWYEVQGEGEGCGVHGALLDAFCKDFRICIRYAWCGVHSEVWGAWCEVLGSVIGRLCVRIFVFVYGVSVVRIHGAGVGCMVT